MYSLQRLGVIRRSEKPLPNIDPLSTLSKYDQTIQPDDALSITVSCYDAALAAPFNLIDPRQAGNMPTNSPLASYLVDSKGDIEFPVLGRIHVGRKTIIEIRDTLYKKIKPYIKEPSINIRRINFRITVLGEVARPGSFSINSERITVLEALGLAGDMTPYSDRQRAGTIVTYSNNSCDIITDGNVGWGGPAAPGTPANNPRNFNGTVTFLVSGAGTCTSPPRTVIVTVNQPTTITTQPVSQTFCTDKVATFTVVPAGTGPFT